MCEVRILRPWVCARVCSVLCARVQIITCVAESVRELNWRAHVRACACGWRVLNQARGQARVLSERAERGGAGTRGAKPGSGNLTALDQRNSRMIRRMYSSLSSQGPRNSS